MQTLENHQRLSPAVCFGVCAEAPEFWGFRRSLPVTFLVVELSKVLPLGLPLKRQRGAEPQTAPGAVPVYAWGLQS